MFSGVGVSVFGVSVFPILITIGSKSGFGVFEDVGSAGLVSVFGEGGICDIVLALTSETFCGVGEDSGVGSGFVSIIFVSTVFGEGSGVGVVSDVGVTSVFSVSVGVGLGLISGFIVSTVFTSSVFGFSSGVTCHLDFLANR